MTIVNSPQSTLRSLVSSFVAGDLSLEALTKEVGALAFTAQEDWLMAEVLAILAEHPACYPTDAPARGALRELLRWEPFPSPGEQGRSVTAPGSHQGYGSFSEPIHYSSRVSA